jgi:hypothetical protein
MSDRLLAKYQRNRKVAGPWQIEGDCVRLYGGVIVIPVLAESLSLKSCLGSLSRNNLEIIKRTLIIVVVNNRIDCAAADRADNRKVLSWLQSSPFPGLNLAWVDASSSGTELGAREGVGLARKIGFDLALELLDWSVDPLLISLDADTLVADNYLQALADHFGQSTAGAAVIPFRHQSADRPETERAIRHYELYLRSYLLGLEQAGSPYAYHVLGSACACRAGDYLKIGGMNRRLAAEDFYFLQQLAKTVGVKTVAGTMVSPSPRISERVPFGTGRAVQDKREQRQSYRFIGAAAFTSLGQWLALVAAGLDGSAERLLEQAAHIDPVLSEFLVSRNFAEVWRKLQRNHAPDQRRLAAFHQWFDALRTRQLLTQLDRAEEGSEFRKVADLLAWCGYPGVDEEGRQLALLEQLQGVSRAALP